MKSRFGKHTGIDAARCLRNAVPIAESHSNWLPEMQKKTVNNLKDKQIKQFKMIDSCAKINHDITRKQLELDPK